MESSRAFAKEILERLFFDLRRFAPGRASELDRLLDRSPQYFRRVSAGVVRLDHAAVASRFAGLRLTERLSLMTGLEETGLGEKVPLGAPGFFRRYRLQPTDRPALRHIRRFLEWGYGLDIQADTVPLILDIDARFAGLGIRKPTDPLSLAYANVMVDCLVEARPPALPPDGVRDLCGSIFRWLSAMPSGRSAMREAANLLDLGFHWEKTLGDLQLRQQLFAEGARVCLGLGHPVDALWCLRQATLLAALRAEPETFETLRLESRRVFEEHFGKPASPASSIADELRLKGRADQIALLRAVQSDRALSNFGSRELDDALGGRRTFTNALNGRGSMGLARWRHLIDLLGVDLEHVLDRAAVLDPVPPPIGNLLLGLKISKPHRPRYAFQKTLLQWSKDVRIDANAPRIDLPREVCSAAEQEPVFSRFIESLHKLERQSRRLHPEDASLLGEGLIRACYLLRYQSYLDDAIDLLTIGFRLQDATGNLAEMGKSYRSAAYLALDLGQLQFADILAARAREIDLATGSLAAFSLSLHAQSLIYRVANEPLVSYRMTRSCISLSQRKLSPLGLPLLKVFLANTCLEMSDLAGAQHLIDSVESGTFTESPMALAQFLSTKAEVCSRLGRSPESVALFDQASKLLSPDSAPRDLALIGLAKCSHLIRNGLLQQARAESARLLRLSSRLKSNPIGYLALQEAVNRTLEGSINEQTLRKIRRQILYPNLPKSY